MLSWTLKKAEERVVDDNRVAVMRCCCLRWVRGEREHVKKHVLKHDCKHVNVHVYKHVNTHVQTHVL